MLHVLSTNRPSRRHGLVEITFPFNSKIDSEIRFRIYRFDGKGWLECSMCLNRTHVECESEYGLTVARDLHDMRTNGTKIKSTGIFLCPECRIQACKKKDCAFDIFCNHTFFIERYEMSVYNWSSFFDARVCIN